MSVAANLSALRKEIMKIQVKSVDFKELVNFLADVNYSLHDYELVRERDEEVTVELLKETYDYDDIGKYICFEEKLAHDLMSGKSIAVIDHSDDDESHSVTLKDFIKGLNKLANTKDYVGNFVNLVNERYDINDEDAWLQAAVFGDVIYG